MSTKIIFVGPSGSGKTTLRKVFFEGENSSKLLEYALEPTYGEESLIMRLPGLNKNIGIFDLAGQENQRWLETEEKSIFYNTTVILIVIDITLGIDQILEFIKKVIEIRNLLSSSTMIYTLIHKIDLVHQNDIPKINSKIKDVFSNENLIKFVYTSLKQPHFTQTFSYFIEIIKICFQEENSEEGLMLDVIDESIIVINHIDEEITTTKTALMKKLHIPEKLLDYLIEHLVAKKHIEISKIKTKEVLSLTDIGRYHFKNILKQFSSESSSSVKIDPLNNELVHEEKIPPFIGALIADKNGILLVKIELFENALERYLLNKLPDDEKITTADLELIPMFICALEKFSTQININDLTGFDLVGSNLKMQIYGYEDYTVTFFMNPDINIKPVDYDVNEYFKNIFNDFHEEFENAIKSGKVDTLFPLIKLGKDWLEELNKSYEDLIFNLEIYDTEQARNLYSKIDDLYNSIEIKFSFILEKIKKMKITLMKAILEKDFEELKKIAKISQDLSSEYAIDF